LNERKQEAAPAKGYCIERFYAIRHLGFALSVQNEGSGFMMLQIKFLKIREPPATTLI
jgi:hypothetical protein